MRHLAAGIVLIGAPLHAQTPVSFVCSGGCVAGQLIASNTVGDWDPGVGGARVYAGGLVFASGREASASFEAQIIELPSGWQVNVNVTAATTKSATSGPRSSAQASSPYLLLALGNLATSPPSMYRYIVVENSVVRDAKIITPSFADSQGTLPAGLHTINLSASAWSDASDPLPVSSARWSVIIRPLDATCFANCDGSTMAPRLTVLDYLCFEARTREARGLPHEQQITSYANCDGSTTPPVLNAHDFACFLQHYQQPEPATNCSA